MKQTPQALSIIPTTADVARECVNKLRAICGHHAVLPSSCITSGEIARVGDGPIVSSAIADLWEGTHDGKKVAIKYWRVPLNDDQTLKKLRASCGISLSRLSENALGLCSHFSKTPLCGTG